jgi:hypothetical protein
LNIVAVDFLFTRRCARRFSAHPIIAAKRQLYPNTAVGRLKSKTSSRLQLREPVVLTELEKLNPVSDLSDPVRNSTVTLPWFFPPRLCK